MTDVTPGKGIRRLTPALLLIAIGVVLALILLFSSFFVVDQKEEAVVLNFGKVLPHGGTGAPFQSALRRGEELQRADAEDPEGRVRLPD